MASIAAVLRAFAEHERAFADTLTKLAAAMEKGGVVEDDGASTASGAVGVGGKRKRAKGVKKVRDPDQPKRPQSAFLLWTADKRRAHAGGEEDDGLEGIKGRDLVSKLGEMWRGLPDEEKKVRAGAGTAQQWQLQLERRLARRGRGCELAGAAGPLLQPQHPAVPSR